MLDPVLAASLLDRAATKSAIKYMLSQRMQTTFERLLAGSVLRTLWGRGDALAQPGALMGNKIWRES